MEPAIDAFTTSYSPARRAEIAMMSSAALPKVAFSSPPIPSPSALGDLLGRAPHPAGERHDREARGDEDEEVALRRQVLQGDRDGDEDQQPVHEPSGQPPSAIATATSATPSTAMKKPVRSGLARV